MDNSLLNSLNDTTKKNLTSAGNMAANISVVMLLVFIAQLGFALYILTQISEHPYSFGAGNLTVLALTIGGSCYIGFLYFTYYRNFSDALTLALKENDSQYFSESCLYLKKIFTLQFIATVLGIGLVILSIMRSL